MKITKFNREEDFIRFGINLTVKDDDQKYDIYASGSIPKEKFGLKTYSFVEEIELDCDHELPDYIVSKVEEHIISTIPDCVDNQPVDTRRHLALLSYLKVKKVTIDGTDYIHQSWSLRYILKTLGWPIDNHSKSIVKDGEYFYVTDKKLVDMIINNL